MFDMRSVSDWFTPQCRLPRLVTRSRFFLTQLIGLIVLALIGTTAIFGIPAAVAADVTNSATAMHLSTDLTNGAQIFQAHCEGCHLNGGNIIRRGKTLKLNALQRNGMDSLEAITEIVTHGKNNMSAFHDRLTEQQIADVAVYVLDQAETGWKKAKN